jgi:predicted nucleic acid-binding protein
VIVVDTTVWIDFRDCLIASTCLETGAEIYHNDRDFDALARVSDLAIYRPA